MEAWVPAMPSGCLLCQWPVVPCLWRVHDCTTGMAGMERTSVSKRGCIKSVLGEIEHGCFQPTMILPAPGCSMFAT